MIAVVLLIPAYEPGERLVALVDELLAARPDLAVAVVDDGSGPAFDDVFAAVEARGCLVQRHPRNRGKGRALKAGLELVADRFPGEAVVTADCDGQHTAADILMVADRIAAASDAESIVLGVRRFDGPDVPRRSRHGNQVSRLAYRAMTGQDVRDTQTGLRGYPAAAIPWLLGVAGDRFEYEFRVLLGARAAGFALEQVDIDTVYLDGNRSSHFRAIGDSLRVVAPIVRFALSSMLAFVVDTAVFLVLHVLTGSLLVAVVAARAVSGSVNFAINRSRVFDGGRGIPLGRAAGRYAALAAVLLAANYGAIDALTTIGVPLLAAKLATEATLFLASFDLQRSIVFAGSMRARPLRGERAPEAALPVE
ncbi:glycosyltransferase [Agromyces sp. NPDC004153]